MKNIKEIQEKYCLDFQALSDAASQCDYLILLGMRYSADETVHITEHRIANCKTAIWFYATKDSEGCHIQADSESLLVKGLFAIFQNLYTNASVDEVRKHPPYFLKYISDQVIYPEIKTNGMKICYQKLIAL